MFSVSTTAFSMATDGSGFDVTIGNNGSDLDLPDSPVSASKPVVVSLEARFYATPSIAVIGITCNVLAAIVLCSPRMRNTTAAHYLTALAVSDSFMLLSELVKWLDSSRVGPRTISASDAICKLTYHVRYASQLLSAFLVTTVSIERYIVVVHPLRAASVLSLKVARVNILVETAVAIILGSYGAILFQLVMWGSPYCLMNLANATAYQWCNLIISKIFGEIVTSFAVVVLTSMVIWTLVRSWRARGNTLRADGKSASSSGEQQLTAMLMVVVLAFVFLRAPYTICWYLGHYGSHLPAFTLNAHMMRMLNDAQNYTYIIYMLNYAINFFLYSISGSRFRRTLAALCCIRFRSGGDVISGQGQSHTSVSIVGRDEGSVAMETKGSRALALTTLSSYTHGGPMATDTDFQAPSQCPAERA